MKDAYDPEGLSISLKQRVQDLKDLATRLELVTDGLTPQADGTYQDYFAQHAEERLDAIGQRVSEVATSLNYLSKRYTLTGLYRVEAERRQAGRAS